MEINNKEDMLEAIRIDRPDSVIHTVFDYADTGNGYYNVSVDMESYTISNRRRIRIDHAHCVIQYPIDVYNNLYTEFKQKNKY